MSEAALECQEMRAPFWFMLGKCVVELLRLGDFQMRRLSGWARAGAVKPAPLKSAGDEKKAIAL